MKTLGITLLLLFVAAGCSKAGAKSRPGRGPTFAGEKPPTGLLAVASVKSPKSALADMANYANAIQPGAGASLDTKLIGMGLGAMFEVGTLSGLDMAKPLHLLVVSPEKYAQPVVVFAGVSDEKALTASADGLTVEIKDGRALIGDKEAVAAVADFAWKGLAKDKTPGAPTVTVFVTPLMKEYRATIEDAKQNMVAMMSRQGGGIGAILEAEIDIFLAIADQSDRIVMTLDANKQFAEVDFALVPLAGTAFEKFNTAQHPSDFSLVGKLPAGGADMVMAGRWDFSPVRPQLLAFMAPVLAELLGAKVDDAMLKQIGGLMDLIDGEMAATMQMGQGGAMTMSEVFATSDGAAVIKQSKALFGGPARTVSLLGMKMMITTDFDLPAVDGAAQMELSAKLDTDDSDMGYAQRQMWDTIYPDGMHVVTAGKGKYLTVVFGKDAREGTARALAATNGKDNYAPSAGVKAALADAKQRKESTFFYMDLASAMRGVMAPYQRSSGSNEPSSAGMSFGMGFADGAAHFRMTVPSAAIKELTAGLRGAL